MLAWVKGHVWLGSFGKLIAASLFVATFGITGCGDDPVKAGVAKGCTLNSDCNDGLVCGFGLCHQECEESSDCPAGQRCVQSEKTNVCQLIEEAECHFNTDCKKPLVCAVDLQCRNQCNGKEDCLASQECADHVCAEPEEVDDEGGLKGAVSGTGGEGGGGPGPSGGSGGKGGTSGMAGAGGEAPVECTPGGDCELDGMPCQVGVIVCNGDVPSCEVLSDADDGTECGKDKVCSEGACVGCSLGDACQPDADNPCIAGTVSCAQGPACDTEGNVKNGTSCGTNKVCSAGTCAACIVDELCDPAGQPCKNGKRTCNNGPACVATTNKVAGLDCGTDQVCDSGGACVSCVQDGVCTPNGKECHVGLMDCTAGPNCTDTGTPATDGLTCDGSANFNFCKAGVCAACQDNNPCVPTNPCHTGKLNCSTATPTCNDTLANAEDGLVCGDNKSCISGACVTNDRVLSITSAQPAAVPIDAPFSAVTVKLVDKNGANVQGVKIAVLASAGAYAAASANTNASGLATINGRVGRAKGDYTFTVSAPGAASTQFTVNAVVPTDKHVFTLVNANHLSDYATPGPGTISQLYYQARGLASAKDGTLYIASYCNVYSLNAAGVLAHIAGTGTPDAENCGDSGDSGLGTTLSLSDIRSIALDETNGYLYIADASYHRVMQLKVSDGSMVRFAGDKNGTNAEPWGDGGPADSAYLNPVSVQVAPNGDLYIGDSNSSRLRKVDYNSNIITTAFKSPASCPVDGPLSFNGCSYYYYYNQACHMAWDKDGKAFVSAQLCGGGLNSFQGVARVDGPNQLTLIAGKDGTANVAEGGVATSATFASPPSMAFDKAGNLFLAATDEDRVRRVDAITSKITTVAGNGTGAYVGEYVIGTSAQVNEPNSLAFDDANNLYFADSANYAVRGLWNMGATTAPTATLATTGGTGQTVKVDAPFGALTVKLTDASSTNIAGVEVKWKRIEDGSGLGATGVPTATTKTSAAGTSSMTGRVGLATGDYTFEASYADIHGVAVSGSPRSFTVAAEAPAAGTIFPIINNVHLPATFGGSGAATFARMNTANGVVAHSNGTIYASDYYTVYAITPRGEVSVLAGTPGSAGFAGDTGPALGAKLYYPRGLALDETRNILYIADYYNSRVRSVSLDTGVIDTLAGGSTDNVAPYGDGGVGVDAHIGSVDAVSVGPDSKVYIADNSHYRIRVIDPDTTVITTWLNGTYNTGSCVQGTVSLHYPLEHSVVRFATDGSAYISGYICQGTTTNQTYGIIKRASNGTTTRIVGLYSGTETEGADATASALPNLGDFILDANGDIVLSTWTGQRVRKINMTTGKINTLAGDGTAGYFGPSDVSADPGAYVAASTVRFYYPSKLAAWPGGHLLIADRDNHSVRMVW